MDDLEPDMPQPLSRFHPNLGIMMAAGDAPHTPEMAVSVVGVINLWAQIEYNYSSLLARIASADPVAVNAVFQAMISGDARRAALCAAAKAKLPPEESSLILAVIETTKSSRETRNDFAHHLWGVLETRPDCALLMNPKTLARFNAELAAWGERAGRTDPARDPAPTFDRSEIMVWRQKDFDAALTAARKAHRQTVELLFTFEHPAADQRRPSLLADPQIARLYEHHLRESSP